MDIYIYVTLYVVLLIGISFWLKNKSDSEDFLIAGRDRGKWQIMSSKFASSVGAVWFITYTGYAYVYGFSVLSILVGTVISYWLYAYWAVPRLYQDSREKKFYTQGDFVLHKTNSVFTKKVSDIAGIIINFFWLLISIVGGGKVISFLEIMSYEQALVLTSVVILSYILLSGFRAVIVTDVIQTIIIGVLVLLIFFSVINTGNLLEIIFEKTGTIDMFTAVAFLVFGVFAVFSSPERIQQTFSAKSTNEAKKGMMYALVPIAALTLILLLIGLYVHSINPGIDQDLVFLEFIFGFLPEAFISVGVLLFLSGLMSSADTNIFMISSHFAFLNTKQGDKVKKIRVHSVLLVIGLGVIAYFFRDMTKIAIFAGSISMITSVPMMYVIAKGGKSGLKFCLSVLFGLLGLLLGIAVVGIEPPLLVFPIIFSLIGFIPFERFCKAKRV